jgi:hypothetical protein
MNRLRFGHAIAALSLTVAAATAAVPAATAAWDGNAFMRGGGDVYAQAQAPKGRPGPERGPGQDRGRDFRQERHDDRRDRMSEDDRRSLHRDLDKANRELYGRRFQK